MVVFSRRGNIFILLPFLSADERTRCLPVPSLLGIDILSNEALPGALPRTKIRFRGFRGPSQTIRKMQIVADKLLVLSICHV